MPDMLNVLVVSSQEKALNEEIKSSYAGFVNSILSCIPESATTSFTSYSRLTDLGKALGFDGSVVIKNVYYTVN